MESKHARNMPEAMILNANARAYASHRDLISKDVSVYGVPGLWTMARAPGTHFGDDEMKFDSQKMQ